MGISPSGTFCLMAGASAASQVLGRRKMRMTRPTSLTSWIAIFSVFGLVSYALRGSGYGVAASLTVLTVCLVILVARRSQTRPPN